MSSITGEWKHPFSAFAATRAGWMMFGVQKKCWGLHEAKFQLTSAIHIHIRMEIIWAQTFNGPRCIFLGSFSHDHVHRTPSYSKTALRIICSFSKWNVRRRRNRFLLETYFHLASFPGRWFSLLPRATKGENIDFRVSPSESDTFKAWNCGTGRFSALFAPSQVATFASSAVERHLESWFIKDMRHILRIWAFHFYYSVR